MNQVLQECHQGEWRDLSDGCLVSVMNRGVCLSRKLVVPFMLFDRLVVLLSVFPGKMASEVHVPGAHFVAIIGYLWGNLVPVSAISFPASLLGGGLQSEMLYLRAYVAESQHGFLGLCGGWKFDWGKEMRDIWSFWRSWEFVGSFSVNWMETNALGNQLQWANGCFSIRHVGLGIATRGAKFLATGDWIQLSSSGLISSVSFKVHQGLRPLPLIGFDLPLTCENRVLMAVQGPVLSCWSIKPWVGDKNKKLNMGFKAKHQSWLMSHAVTPTTSRCCYVHEQQMLLRPWLKEKCRQKLAL